MTISRNIHKLLISGAALLMFVSVGAASANVNVSAKHIRTHRVYRAHRHARRHSRRALRRYNHKRNVHKYHAHKLAHRRNSRRYYAKRYTHKRNVHKINVRRNRARKHRARKPAIHERLAKKATKPSINLYRMGNDNENNDNDYSSIDPNLMKNIRSDQKQSSEVDMPANYYGDYFDGSLNKKSDHDAFIHLAKYGSYILSQANDNDLPYSGKVHPSNGGNNTDQWGYHYNNFANTLAPFSFKLSNGIMNDNAYTDAYQHPLHKLSSEAQGIKDFQKLDIYTPTAKNSYED